MIIAVARWVRLERDPRTAEFAIVVGDPDQRWGLGTEGAKAPAIIATCVGR
jgi:hypothetical protein